jgi:hypothetical protein
MRAQAAVSRPLCPPGDGISRRLRELAHQAVRLSPVHGDPERFYIEREELVRGLLRLAREAAR